MCETGEGYDVCSHLPVGVVGARVLLGHATDDSERDCEGVGRAVTKPRAYIVIS